MSVLEPSHRVLRLEIGNDSFLVASGSDDIFVVARPLHVEDCIRVYLCVYEIGLYRSLCRGRRVVIDPHDARFVTDGDQGACVGGCHGERDPITLVDGLQV